MRLKQIRLERGYTQKNVADYLQISSNVYSRYELEKRQPTIDSLIRIAKFFDVSVDYMLGISDIPNLAVCPKNFSKYEMELITAAREADDRAREDALNTLKIHRIEKEKENFA